MANETSSPASMRSALGRVRGLGSARKGTHHWWMARVTSLALLPLTFWFVFSMIGLAGASYVETVLWIARPFNAVLLLALIAATFHHMASGLQVVAEDYVRPDTTQMLVVLAIKGVSILLALACAVAVIRIVAAA
ncbi:succinate dehydrogenase, hydrophobic membrane anchor protein [Roseococcus sp. MDT2-1-1]|uniref:Succinate dehydrogenase hydrophobic membrane anchor subunit n=2 Tax=Sabulicella glaciei TaxID=2984948 RepID=A0ABT3P0E6_9PROT|nr:succinate dehydrogenase, hydrophobic membrane anchor protein [Roseococcus sp. MDT2-1-1]